MKKLIYLSLLLSFFGCSTSSKFDEVSKLKEGFQVVHLPNKGKATLNGSSGNKYTWVYQTSVQASQKITIIEFGAFSLINGNWVFSTYTGKPFTQKDFEEWYGCSKGVLIPNQQYTDNNNWTGSDVLKKSESLWYYIGRTESGELVKAMAKLTSIPEIEN